MIVEVNTDYLLKSQLTANQYIMLHLLFEGKRNTLEQFMLMNDLQSEAEDLHKRGFILNWSDDVIIDNLILSRDRCKELFDYQDSFFWELFSTYPIKVPNGDGGTRALRPTSLDAKQTKTLKKKYEKKVKKKDKHEHIMRCLNAEMWMRRKSNTLAYMQKLETYLNQESWYNYEYLLEMSNEQKALKYGEELE